MSGKTGSSQEKLKVKKLMEEERLVFAVCESPEVTPSR